MKRKENYYRDKGIYIKVSKGAKIRNPIYAECILQPLSIGGVHFQF